MSKSPKYNRVGNGERRRQRLERQRQEREQRRREEEARQAKARLNAARTEALSRLAGVEASCTALAAEADMPRDGVQPLLAELRRLRAAVNAASGAADVNTALRGLSDVEERRAAAEAVLMQQRVDDADAQLDVVRGLISSLDAADRRRFDEAGATEVDAQIEELAAALAAGNTEGFAARATRVQNRVLDHRGAVAAAAAQHAETLRNAQDALARLRARHSGLTADARGAKVRLEELDLAAQAIEVVSVEIAADRPTEALAVARKLATRMDGVERDLDQTIDRLTARREMLSSVVEALPGLGFTVDTRSLVEEDDGSIAIQARRLSGEPLAVVVQDGLDDVHRINYLLETSVGVLDGSLDGSACTNLAGLARELNSHIESDGFQPGQVTWDDQARPPSGGKMIIAPGQTQQRGAQA